MRAPLHSDQNDLSATLDLVAVDDQENSHSLQLSEAPDRPVQLDSLAANILQALDYQSGQLGSSSLWGDRYSLLTSYQRVFNRSVTRRQIGDGLESLRRALHRSGFEPNQLLAQNGRTGEYRLLRTLHIQRPGKR